MSEAQTLSYFCISMASAKAEAAPSMCPPSSSVSASVTEKKLTSTVAFCPMSADGGAELDQPIFYGAGMGTRPGAHDAANRVILLQAAFAAQFNELLRKALHGRYIAPHHVSDAREPQRVSDARLMRKIVGERDGTPAATLDRLVGITEHPERQRACPVPHAAGSCPP